MNHAQVSVAQIKYNVQRVMNRRVFRAAGGALPCVIIAVAFVMIQLYLILAAGETPTTADQIIYVISGFFGLFLVTVMLFMMSEFLYRFLKDPKAKISDMFVCIGDIGMLGKTLRASLCAYGVIVLSGAIFMGIPMQVLSNHMEGLSDNTFVLILYAIYIIALLIIMYFASRMIAAFFLRFEDKDKKVRHAVKEAFRIFKPYRKQLILLQLSFVGWIFFCMFTVLAGLLYVLPYYVLSLFLFLRAARGDFKNDAEQGADEGKID